MNLNTDIAMKRVFWIGCLLCLALPLMAQVGTNELNRCPEEDSFEMLDGNRGVLILSKHKDLVISATNLAYPPTITLNGRGLDGYYRYHVIIDARDTKQPKLEVSRMGIPYKAPLLVTLKNPDYLQAYRLEEVSHPIRFEEQTQANDVHFNASEAALEFTSTIKSLKVKCPPELQAQVTSQISKADTSLLIINVVIPLAKLDEARGNVERIGQRLAELDRMMDSLEPDAPEWNELDQLEKQQQEAEARLSAMSSVELYGDGTNYLSIGIADLSPRAKRCYVVLPIVVEKEVFTTQCSALMDEGSRLFGMRKYKAAREAYGKALQTGEGVVAEMKPVIQSAINLCDSCALYDLLSFRCFRKIAELKKQGEATQAEVANYASYGIEYLQQLYKFNPDDYYLKRVDLLENLLDDMGLQVKFTFVEWLTFSEGNPIPGVEVWIYRGMERISSNTFSSDKKFRRMVRKEGHNFQQVGQSGVDGIAEIELDRTNLPTGILFRPKEDSGQKIVYMTFEELMRQARGTYMKKQFRVKMYTK